MKHNETKAVFSSLLLYHRFDNANLNFVGVRAIILNLAKAVLKISNHNSRNT